MTRFAGRSGVLSVSEIHLPNEFQRYTSLTHACAFALHQSSSSQEVVQQAHRVETATASN